MLKNSKIENLEIKLQNARVENIKKFEKIEKNYQKNYKKFIDSFFKTDVLGAKKTISALFQLEAFNRIDKIGGEKNLEVFGKEILENSLEIGLKVLPINSEKREILKNKILKLEENKEKLSEIIIEKTDFSKDKNYPIIDSLFKRKILDNSDMLSIFTNYEKTKDIRFSLEGIKGDKKEIIKKYFYELNDTKKEEKIENFKIENKEEITKLEKKYPANIVNGVVKFVGRNFFKMKPYKKNFEKKKLRLRRTFKIALLKLLRIKYKGFNIDELIKKIDSMQDFESMFRLIMKLIDIIPENNELLEKFSLKEEVDEIEEIITEAESNKEKILKGEKFTIKISELLDETDKKLDTKVLDKLLDEDIDFVGEEVKIRESNAGILSENNIILEEDENEKDEEFVELNQEDLELIYNEIKLEFSILEKQKLDLLLDEDYEQLDEVIDKLIKTQIKLEKIEKLIK